MLTLLGSGHAGYTLAREWRKLNADAPLRIITRDDGANYYKPNLSKAFASGKDADGLRVATAAQMAEQLKAEILTHTEVSELLPAEHALRVGGTRYEYSQLVLATGAQPIRLPVQGDAAAQLLSVNDRDDYARLRARMQPGARVLIVGAGLIGCEFANDFAAAGFDVQVADIAAWPLARLLPEAQGRALQAALQALGVRWHLGKGLHSLSGSGPLQAQLANGERITVDVAISAVGLRPDLTLARAAGLRCAQGLVVDAALQTSAPDVYALGDCIEIGGRLLPYILPIATGARALAATLNGTRTPVKFPAMPVAVKTPACPLIVNPPPHAEGAWTIEGSGSDLTALFNDHAGNACGFALSGTATAQRAALTARMPAVFDPT